MVNISIDQLANEITKAVQEYTEDVTEAIEKEVDEIAKLILKEIKATAPKNTGRYIKGFKSTQQRKDGNKRRVIWNKKESWRVHLLEFGHAKQNGGRVRAFPHVRPAYDKHEPPFVERVKQIIKRGG